MNRATIPGIPLYIGIKISKNLATTGTLKMRVSAMAVPKTVPTVRGTNARIRDMCM